MVPRRVSRFPRLRVHRVGVDQDTERAAVDNEPGDEGTELRWREDIHFEHSDRVWADGLFPELVDAQLGNCRGRQLGESLRVAQEPLEWISLPTFSPNPLPQLPRKRLLAGILLEVVDMDITAMMR